MMRKHDLTVRYSVASRNPTPPDAQQQASIHQLLLTARKVWLSDALHDAMADVDPITLKAEIGQYVPAAAQRILAMVGIREEAVFPLPVVISAKPTLVAYYRLLAGISQKRFYAPATGMTGFKRLEEGAPLNAGLLQRLPAFCEAMCRGLNELVLQADSSLESRDVEDLQFLTLGSYYYGSLNNTIGQTATLGVFNAMLEVVEELVTDRSKDWIDLTTPAGRHYHIQVASDPDMRIVELVGGIEQPLVSIEIKGGTDKANAYNRGGEAEKSHQGAKSRGYTTCWTIIHMANIDVEKLKQGSPTTTIWFDTNEVVRQKGGDWLRFQQAVKEAIAVA